MASRKEIEKIVGKRIEGGHVHYLVKWRSMLQREDSWENEDYLSSPTLKPLLFQSKEPSLCVGSSPYKKVKLNSPTETPHNPMIHPLPIQSNDEAALEQHQGWLQSAEEHLSDPPDKPIQDDHVQANGSTSNTQFSYCKKELNQPPSGTELSGRCSNLELNTAEEHHSTLLSAQPVPSQSHILKKYAQPNDGQFPRPKARRLVQQVVDIVVEGTSKQDNTGENKKGQVEGEHNIKSQANYTKRLFALVHQPSLQLNSVEVKVEQPSYQYDITSFEESRVRQLNQAIMKVIKKKPGSFEQIEPFIIQRDARDLVECMFQIRSRPRKRRCKSLRQYNEKQRERDLSRLLRLDNKPIPQDQLRSQNNSLWKECGTPKNHHEELDPISFSSMGPLEPLSGIMFISENSRSPADQSHAELDQSSLRGSLNLSKLSDREPLANSNVAANNEQRVQIYLGDEFEQSIVKACSPPEDSKPPQPILQSPVKLNEPQAKPPSKSWVKKVVEVSSFKGKKVTKIINTQGEEKLIEFNVVKSNNLPALVKYLQEGEDGSHKKPSN